MITNKLTDTALTTKDFFYDLPKELIAQTPAEPRDSSRLLVLHKDTGETEHRIFRDIIDYLHEGDVLHKRQQGHPGKAVRREGGQRDHR